MTTPPTGGTIGSGGYESGDDFVAARVTIDVPTEGIAGLREITQEMDRFRTSVEAANRSSETFSSYLQRIGEAAQQATTGLANVVEMMQRNAELQNQATVSGAGGPQPQLNAPPQYTNPWAGQSLGLGGGGGGAMGMGVSEDVNTQLNALRTQNPRAFINKMAATGQYRMGDIPAASPSGVDIQGAADRIGQRAQIQQEGADGTGGMGGIGSRAGRMGAVAQQVLNEISPGSNPLGVSGMIQRGLGGLGGLGTLSNMAGMGGAIGRVAGMALPAAGVLGVAAAGYGLVQGAGGIYQDYKNMGMVRGGGAAEGVGYEIGIRTLAMNPFISGDQARQIIQQGLREGYTGKEFDTVTQMVASNLKDFNIQIADSFALVRKNVVEGGQSMLGLASDLGILKGVAAGGGYRSMPAMVNDYQSTSAALISAGMSGTQAAAAATTAATMFSDNAVLAGQGAPTVAAMMSPNNLAMIRYQGGADVPAGLMPGAMSYMMSDEAITQGGMNVLKRYAMLFWNSAGKPQPRSGVAYYNAVERWRMRAVSMGMPWAEDKQKAEEMFFLIVQGKDPVKDANAKNEEVEKEQSELKQRNPLSMTGGGLVSLGAAAGNLIGSTVGAIGGTVADVFTDNTSNIDDRWKDWATSANNRAGSVAAAFSPYKISTLDQINKEFGSTGYEVLNEKGEVVKDFMPTNATAMRNLSDGKYTWRPKGSTGKGMTLGDTPQGEGLKQIAGGKTEVSGQVTIGLTSEAQRLLRVQGSSTVPLTPHEEQANRGYGTATPNNPAPGYDMPRGGR